MRDGVYTVLQSILEGWDSSFYDLHPHAQDVTHAHYAGRLLQVVVQRSGLKIPKQSAQGAGQA
jgi:hypothetical protein